MRARANLICCAAAGEEANFEREFPEASDRQIEAGWICDLLLQKMLQKQTHIQVSNNYPAYCAPPSDAPVKLTLGNFRVRGAHVSGSLDLSWCGSAAEPLPALSFVACSFECTERCRPSIDLSDTHLGGLKLTDCRLTQLRGVGMCISGSVDLVGIRALDEQEGTVCWCNLSRAVISGNLLADRVRLYAPRRSPIAEFKYPDFFELAWAINLYMARVSGSVMMRIAPAIDGGILLTAAEVRGDIRISSATVLPLDFSHAISAERASIGGSLTLDGTICEPFMCRGTIWLMLTRLAGSLDLYGMTVQGTSETECSIYARGMTVGGWVTFNEVVAAGLICMRNVQIDGNLDMEKVEIQGSSKLAVWFTVPDWLRLLQEKKRSPLFALDGSGARIGADLRLRNNVFQGSVDLCDARCTTLDDDELRGYGGNMDVRIDGFKYERLSDAHNTVSRIGCWLPGKMKRYRPQPYVQLAKVLASHGDDIHARDVLVKKAGLDAKQNWCRSYGSNGRPKPSLDNTGTFGLYIRRLIYFLVLKPYGAFFNYGMSPLKAAITLTFSILLGAAMFWWIDHRNAMVVAQMPVATFVTQGKAKIAGSPGPPKFVATLVQEASALGAINCGLNTGQFILYAADVFIPLVDLREESKCEIDRAGVSAMPSDEEIALYQMLKAGYAILGWVVTTLSLLTFSGVMRHRLSQD